MIIYEINKEKAKQKNLQQNQSLQDNKILTYITSPVEHICFNFRQGHKASKQAKNFHKQTKQNKAKQNKQQQQYNIYI